METLITCAALAGVRHDILLRINDCVTTDAALEILFETGSAAQTLDILTERIGHYLTARVHDQVRIGAVIFSNQHNLLLKTSLADQILDTVTGE